MLRAVANNIIAVPLFAGFYLHDGLAGLLRGAHVHYRTGRAWSRLFLKAIGVQLAVRFAEPLDPSRQYVLVSNHLSYVDTPVLYAALPVPFRFVARGNLFRVPVVGAHLRRGGHIGIDRDDPRSALRTLARAAEVIREQKVSILIFAEGTRSKGTLQTFRSGASWLALKAGVDLVPVAIRGTGKVLPRGSFLIRPGAVEVRTGAAISVAGLSMREREDLTALLRERVASLLGETGSAGMQAGDEFLIL
jgi:1-acyl-sn-glycerol-3-phosphate acyltransferase